MFVSVCYIHAGKPQKYATLLNIGIVQGVAL